MVHIIQIKHLHNHNLVKNNYYNNHKKHQIHNKDHQTNHQNLNINQNNKVKEI